MTITNIELNPACENCKFYRIKTYQCKVNPPTVIVIPRKEVDGSHSLQPAAMVPMVGPSDWCGQFEPGTNHENGADQAEEAALKLKAANAKPSNEGNIIQLR